MAKSYQVACLHDTSIASLFDVSGSADISFNAPCYLLPSDPGRAKFGIFGGPLIYLWENY